MRSVVVAEALRLLIIESEPGAADGLRALLEGPHAQWVVGPIPTASPGEGLRRQLGEQGPDVVLIAEGSWPAGPEAWRPALAVLGDRAVVLVQDRDDPEAALEAIAAGVHEVLAADELGADRLYRAVERAQARAAGQARERRARHEAEAALRTKSALLAHLGHEIRTPLGGMIGLADVLLDSPLGRDQREFAVQIGRCGHDLLRLLDNLLELARSEAGRLVLEPTVFDLRGLVAEVAALLRPQAQAKGLTLSVQMAAGLPGRREGDARRLRQVLLNLVGNAVKFTDAGRVTISVTPSPWADDPTRTLNLIVQDTGVGIDLATQAQLFQPFAQADGMGAQRGGTGLGLAISRELISLMGGQLDLSSQPGVGSRFSIELDLPLAQPERPGPEPLRSWPPPAAALVPPPRPPEPPRQPPLPLPLRTAAPPALAPGTPAPELRVLLAEDHETNRWLLGCLLEQAGARVEMAVDGRDAVEAFGREPFDLILLDLDLPGLSGLDAVRAIRAHEAAAAPPAPCDRVPILAATAYDGSEILGTCQAAGFDALLTKPISRSDLQFWLDHAAARRLGTGTDADCTARAIERWRQRSRTPLRAGKGRSPGDPEPAYDPQQALELYEGDAALVADLARSFVHETPEVLRNLAAAIRTGDLPGVAAQAHGLKGMSLTIAAARMTVLADALHQAAAKGMPTAASLRLDAVRAHWSILRGALEELAATLQPAAADRPQPD